MKVKSLSIVAAGAILGLGLLSGCGGGSSGVVSPAALSGIGASDGYVIKLVTNATAFCSDTNTTYTSAATVGARGALTFSGVTLTSNCTVTVPADAWIDADNSGDFNSTLDKQVGFAMRAPGDAKFVSQLTTLAVDTNNSALLSLVKDFDPVVAAVTATSDNNTTANNAKKLLILGEALKTAYTGGSSDAAKALDVSQFTDVNITAADVNLSAVVAPYTGGAGVQAAIEAKATSMQALAETLDDLKAAGVDVADVVVQVSDGGKSLAQALIADGNKTLDGNVTAAVNAVEATITTATTAASSLPAKLSIGSLKLGNQTVALNGNTFNTTVSTADANISDFYNVSFPSVALNKSFAQQTVGVSVKISDAHSNQVTLSVAGAKLSPNDTNTSVKIALPTTATVSFSETGLTALQAALGATSATTSITSALNPTDLAFNVDTILDSIGSSNIPAGLAALNTYLKTSGVYDVNITFTGLNQAALTTDYTSFVGKVTVKGDVTAPTAPTLGTLTASSLVVTAEAGSTIAIKNGSAPLATATATGSAQTISFTALSATTALSVTATDRYGNVSPVATKTFTYTAPVVLSASSFTGKVYTFSNGIVLSFTDATHFTMVDSPDTYNGTWAITSNVLSLTVNSEISTLTFSAQPAQGVTVTPANMDDNTPVTISSIGTYTAPASPTSGFALNATSQGSDTSGVTLTAAGTTEKLYFNAATGSGSTPINVAITISGTQVGSIDATSAYSTQAFVYFDGTHYYSGTFTNGTVALTLIP